MITLLKTFVRLLIHCITFLCLFLAGHICDAQHLTQTIRGTVIDKISQSPVQGAIVQITDVTPVIGTTTDNQGKFILNNIPVGRQGLKISYIGYKEYTIPNITVNSGKEVVLTVQLEENIIEAREVVIKARVEKNKPLNEMSAVSTRTFSVEETQKFAAAVNDPARMATSFAGVVTGHDGNNTISIRGNSPNGLLWKMEGVDIPNPNHFSNVGTSGGGVSILSAQLLSNSDFMTGAFAAEYGNALSGVFDLKLRKGNNQKREYTFQAGVLGVDIASEGPVKKGYDGSYLINYRYSTLSLLGLMGVNVVGDATIDFQDISFNVSLPSKKLGTFGVFGFGGLSSQTRKGSKDSLQWKEETYKQFPGEFHAYTGAFGINNTRLFGTRSYLKTSLVFSGNDNGYNEKKINPAYEIQENYEQSYIQSRLALSSTFTHKINSKNSIRTGFILSSLNYNLFQKYLVDSIQQMKTFLETEGHTATIQAFGQWNHKLDQRFSANIGLHTLYLALNNTYSIEPRASVKYDISSSQNIALGYGLHGQIQPLGAYFAKDANNNFVNKKLEMTKAHHIVLSHDININSYTHIKTEAYYQYLFDVPLTTNPASTFSILNAVEGYNTDPLVNNGAGKNYGLELTFERFLHKSFYYLLSLSLYESKYRANNDQWYNTRFNTNFATTLTAGKEWELSEKRKRKVIGLSTKLVYVGGLRETPIDLNRSIASGQQQEDESRPFTIQNPDYFRIDIKLSLKRNFTHSTSTLSLDLQNATNRENVGGQYFNKNTGKIQYFYQAGLIPVFAYKIEF